MHPLLQSLGYGVIWDVLGILTALVVWPAALALMPPAIAWGVSRLLAPAAIAYLAIFPSLVTGQTPFHRGTILAAAAILAAISWLRFRGKLPRPREAAPFEAVYGIFLLLGCLYVPFIASLEPMGERLRDAGLLNAVWTQSLFPVQEPWFAGYRIQYYMFGYYVPSVVGLFAAPDTLIAYNLIIAATFAAFGAAVYLIFAALGRRQWECLVGAAAVALGSNVAACAQMLTRARHYDWWSVSRVIANTINEFPLWSASLGDLHPHYLGMWLVPTLLAVSIGMLFAERKAPVGWAYASLAGWLCACVWGTNTWELPVALVLAAAALFARARDRRALLVLPAATFLGALPFLSTLPRAHKALGWVHLRSSFAETFGVLGLFLLPIAVGAARALVERYGRRWLAVWAGALAVAFFTGSGTLLLMAVTAPVARLAWRKPERDSLAVYLALAGLGLILLCEVVHLEDIFGDAMERLNTVFKYYIPAWTLLGVSAALFALELSRALPRWAGGVLLGTWLAALSGHLLFGLNARTGGFHFTHSLDGYDHWRTTAPDDAAVMEWMRAQVREGKLRGTILEAVGGAYHSFGRVMTTTGLPGYFAWEGYGGMLQTLGNDPELARRSKRAKDMLDGNGFADCPQLASALREERIRYVFVGELERRTYRREGLDLLARCLPTVFARGDARVLSAD